MREGVITPDQAQTHPMRNFVECCLGGEPFLPEMSLSLREPLEANDILLVCSDGLWGGTRRCGDRRRIPAGARAAAR